MYNLRLLSLSRTYNNIKKVYRNNIINNFSSNPDGPNDYNSVIPKTSRIIIAGGGIIGCSVAYHLAKKGVTDVLILEKGQLTCGTTWHAAGLVGQLRSTEIEAGFARFGKKLFEELEAEIGIGWKQCGSLYLARTTSRMTYYKRCSVSSNANGLQTEILTPYEINEKYPILNSEGLQGGIWVPTDGVVNPTDLTMAYANKAKHSGVVIKEGVTVEEILSEDRKITGVKTNYGIINCEIFVNCTGQWARFLGEKSTPNIRVPLHSCEHFYIVTNPFGVDPMMPTVRDYDGHIYTREWGGGLLCGCFEAEAKPCFHESVPNNFEFQLLPEDWDHFGPILDELLKRIPSLQSAQVRKMYNGPESFTPDGKAILGESPGIKKYFIAAGMNSSGIALSAGIGNLLSSWIIDGDITVNALALDCRRFVDLHNNRKFLRDRVKEVVALLTGGSPFRELIETKYGRKLRLSPLYARYENDAELGQMMGYERPVYYGTTSVEEDASAFLLRGSERPGCENLLDTSMTGGSINAYCKPTWFDKVKTEYWACREGVSVIDMSTFTKFELQSSDNSVVNFLQYICANDIDRDIGTVIHTGMLNKRGGFENDCSLVRLTNNRFFMISPTTQQTRGLAWIRKHLPKNGSVQVSDVTSMYAAINVIGPKSHAVLSELTDISLSSTDFKAMTCKVMHVGQASGILAMRLTHAGEDGWTLYVPSEYALHVYDCIMEAGKNYGIRNSGYYALRTLRTERFFAYWGTDLSPIITPMECGRDFRVKFDGPDFIGKAALLKQRDEGVNKRLVQFLISDHNVHVDPWPWGGEPIYRNNELVGTVTSAAYGFTLARQVCLGFVSNPNKIPVTQDFITDKTCHYQIDVAGMRYSAKPNIFPQKL